MFSYFLSLLFSRFLFPMRLTIMWLYFIYFYFFEIHYGLSCYFSGIVVCHCVTCLYVHTVYFAILSSPSILARPLPHPAASIVTPPTPFLDSCLLTPAVPCTSALGQWRVWSRRTWAVYCQCVTSAWTWASCTRCPCWLSVPTCWWLGSSSVWLLSWQGCAAAECLRSTYSVAPSSIYFLFFVIAILTTREGDVVLDACHCPALTLLHVQLMPHSQKHYSDLILLSLIYRQ